MWRAAAAVVSIACFAACGEPPPLPLASASLAFPQVGGDPASVFWSPKPGTPSPVVARIDGYEMTVADLQRHADAEGTPADRRELLDRAVTFELLAQQALGRGLDKAPDVVAEYRRALVQRLLRRELEENLNPETVKREDLEWAYKQVKFIYNHPDHYSVADMQIVCCRKAPEVCEKDSDAARCFTDRENEAWEAYREASSAAVSTADALKTTVRSLQGRGMDVVFSKYAFFYDASVAWAEQKGYDLINENVQKAAASLMPGQMAQPIRSHAAWHVLLLLEHEPARHDPLDTPAVLEEIRRRVYPEVQKRDFVNMELRSLREHKVQFYDEHLDLVAPPSGPR